MDPTSAAPLINQPDENDSSYADYDEHDMGPPAPHHHHMHHNHHSMHHHHSMLAENSMEDFGDDDGQLGDDPSDDFNSSLYSQYQHNGSGIRSISALTGGVAGGTLNGSSSSSNKIRKRSANQAYEYLTQLPDSKAFQEWLSQNETDFTWVHKRNSMTNAGKKYYYICNYRIKKGYHIT